MIDEPKPRTVTSIDGAAGERHYRRLRGVIAIARSDQPVRTCLLRWRKRVKRSSRVPAATPDAIVEANKLRWASTIVPVTPALAEKYHLSVEDGIFVNEVIRDSIAARAGLEPGDVVVQLGRYRVSIARRLLGALLHRLPKGRTGAHRRYAEANRWGLGRWSF